MKTKNVMLCIKWFSAWDKGLKIPEFLEEDMAEFEEKYEDLRMVLPLHYREIFDYMCSGLSPTDVAMVKRVSKWSVYGKVRLMQKYLKWVFGNEES